MTTLEKLEELVYVGFKETDHRSATPSSQRNAVPPFADASVRRDDGVALLTCR